MRFQVAYDCSSWLVSAVLRKFQENGSLAEEKEFVRYSEDDSSHELLQILRKISSFDEVELVFSAGPGSFTGLRVNAAIALGFHAFLGERVKIFSVSLRDISRKLNKPLFVKITDDDYGEISPEKFRFVRYKDGIFISESETISQGPIVVQSDKVYIYCDLDDERFKRKPVTQMSVARMILENRSLWRPVDIKSIELDYGSPVSFKKFSPPTLQTSKT